MIAYLLALALVPTQMAADLDRYTFFEVEDVDLRGAMKALSEKTGIPIDVQGNVNGSSRFSYSTLSRTKPIAEILNRIMQDSLPAENWYSFDKGRVTVFRDQVIDLKVRAGESLSSVVDRMFLGRPKPNMGRINGKIRESFNHHNRGFHLMLLDILGQAEPPMTFAVYRQTYTIKQRLDATDSDRINLMMVGDTGERRGQVLSANRNSWFILSTTRVSKVDAATGELIVPKPLLGGETMIVSPRNSFVAVGVQDNLVILDQNNLKTVGVARTDAAPNIQASFSADERLLLAADAFRFRVYNTAQFAEIQNLDKQMEALNKEKQGEYGWFRRAFFNPTDSNTVIFEFDRMYAGYHRGNLKELWHERKTSNTLLPPVFGSDALHLVGWENNCVVWRKVDYKTGGSPASNVWQTGGIRPRASITENQLCLKWSTATKSETSVFTMRGTVEDKPKPTIQKFKPSQRPEIDRALQQPAEAALPPVPELVINSVPGAVFVGPDPNAVFMQFGNQIDAFSLSTGKRMVNVRATPPAPPPSSSYSAEATLETITVRGPNNTEIYSLDVKERLNPPEDNRETPVVGVDGTGKMLIVSFRGATFGYAIEESEKRAKYAVKARNASFITFDPTNQFVILTSIDVRDVNDTMVIRRVKTGEVIYDGPGQLAHFDHNANMLYIAANGRMIRRAIEAVSGSDLSEKVGGGPVRDRVRQIMLTSDKKRIIGRTDGGVIAVWDQKECTHLVSHVAMPKGRYITFVPQNYFYMASRGSAKLIFFTRLDQAYAFEQFDLTLNRPDIVLSRLGIKDDEKIQALTHAHRLRLLRAGLISKSDLQPYSAEQVKSLRETKTEDEIKAMAEQLAINAITPKEPPLNPRDIPGVDFMSEVPRVVGDLNLKVKIQAVSNTVKLESLNILVNGCPIYGPKGLDIHGEGKFDKEETLRLSPGMNLIRLVAMNSRGGEARTKAYRVLCQAQGPRKPNLYFVGIGANVYQHSDKLGALVSDSDVKSLLATANSMKGNPYGNVIAKTFIGPQVTREAMKEAKVILDQATEDDTVILFYGGHGIIDDSEGTQEYYLAGYSTNPEQLKDTGINIDDFNAAFTSCKSRQVLVLIDACHAGEVDDEPGSPFAGANSGETGTSRGTGRSVGSIPSTIRTDPMSTASRAYLSELFEDLRQGTGAFVIGACAGDQVAMENGKNGVFTHCILEGLKGAADRSGNNNGVVTINELNDYLLEQVPVVAREKTGRSQRPTSRAENLDNDFALGAIPKAAPLSAPAPAKKATKKKGGG